MSSLPEAIGQPESTPHVNMPTGETLVAATNALSRLPNSLEIPKSAALPITSAHITKLVAQSGFSKDEITRLKQVLFGTPGAIVYILGAIIQQAKTTSSLVVSTNSAEMSQGVSYGVFSLFLGFYNTYDIIKNWKKNEPATDKGLKIAGNISQYAVAAKGISTLIKTVEPLAHIIHANVGIATSAATVLGPIGPGLGAIVSTAKGIQAAMKAADLTKKINLIENKKLEDTQKPIAAAACKILKHQRKFEILDAIRSFVLAIGLGLATIVAVGALIGVAMTPIGWAAAGIVLTGLIISIAVTAYKRRQEANLVTELNKAKIPEISLSESPTIDDKLKTLISLLPDIKNDPLFKEKKT